MMKDLCHKLEQLLNQNFNQFTFSDRINAVEIKQFEIENNWNLPPDLKQFFLWQNGIQIEDKFRFLSLKEAFDFYTKETKGFKSDFILNDSEFDSSKETQIFQKEMEDYNRKSDKQKDFWLPIFIQTTNIKPIIHAIWLSEIEAQNANWVKINSPQTHQPFDFKFMNQDNYTLNYYTEISPLLQVSMEILNPEKTSFWTELKGTLSSFGKMFE